MSSENFPLLTKGVYLNTAYVGLMSKPMAAFRNKYENKFLYQGGNYKTDAYSSLEMTHHSLARFFGLTPDHIFVVPNFSFGIRSFTSARLSENNGSVIPARRIINVNSFVLSIADEK